MPILKSAIKKMRQAKVHQDRNYNERRKIKETLDSFRKSPKEKGLFLVFSVLDRAVKSGVVHKNKASRLKSRLSKLLKKK